MESAVEDVPPLNADLAEVNDEPAASVTKDEESQEDDAEEDPETLIGLWWITVHH